MTTTKNSADLLDGTDSIFESTTNPTSIEPGDGTMILTTITDNDVPKFIPVDNKKAHLPPKQFFRKKKKGR